MEKLFCGHKSRQMLLLWIHLSTKQQNFTQAYFFYALEMLVLLIESNRMSKNQASVILLLCPCYLLSVTWSHFSSPCLHGLLRCQMGSLIKGSPPGSGSPTKDGISIFQSKFPIIPYQITTKILGLDQCISKQKDEIIMWC